MKTTTKNLCLGALVAALYAGLTFMSNLFGIAYGPVQFRFSEALCILPVFSPAAIFGLGVGCFVSNIASFNPIDMIFGTVATLSAALLSYYLRNIKLLGLPVLSALAPVVINAAVVGAEITMFLYPTGAVGGFFVAAAWVFIGESATAFFLGLLFYSVINRNKKLLKLFT